MTKSKSIDMTYPLIFILLVVVILFLYYVPKIQSDFSDKLNEIKAQKQLQKQIELNEKMKQETKDTIAKNKVPSNKYCGFAKSEDGRRTSIGLDCPSGERCVETYCVFVVKTTDAGNAYACDGICK